MGSRVPRVSGRYVETERGWSSGREEDAMTLMLLLDEEDAIDMLLCQPY